MSKSKKYEWKGKNNPIHWTDESKMEAYVSVIFSWHLQKAISLCIWYTNLGYNVFVGGAAAILNRDTFDGIATVEYKTDYDVLAMHNEYATFTSRGCVRSCGFCLVPKIEGDLVELDDWKPNPIICDNNFLACSKRHFDDVIDKLKAASIKGVDFNQGLDARLMTQHHADRIAELNLAKVRFSWDYVGMENDIARVVELCDNAKIKREKIVIYMLIGYKDTPEEAMYRIIKSKEWGCHPRPMIYQDLHTEKKNSFVGEHWTKEKLRLMTVYCYSRAVWKMSFDEFIDKHNITL